MSARRVSALPLGPDNRVTRSETWWDEGNENQRVGGVF